jgi:hypothetical protein
VPAGPVSRAPPLIAGLHRTPAGATLGAVFGAGMKLVGTFATVRFARSGCEWGGHLVEALLIPHSESRILSLRATDFLFQPTRRGEVRGGRELTDLAKLKFPRPCSSPSPSRTPSRRQCAGLGPRRRDAHPRGARLRATAPGRKPARRFGSTSSHLRRQTDVGSECRPQDDVGQDHDCGNWNLTPIRPIRA